MDEQTEPPGDWMRTSRTLASMAHYFSTHCLHDHHDECKGTCKHCPERCRCDCHGEA